MKNQTIEILKTYLGIYKEDEKLCILKKFLSTYNSKDIIDWNNFYGHLVASAFIFSKKQKKFLTLYHKEFNTYIYPGGHFISSDKIILDAAKREVLEETGINDFQIYKICENELVPFDIDMHEIRYNELLDLPKHFHFDFRYLFIVDNIPKVKLDHESSDYKWVGLDEIGENPYYGKIKDKLETIIKSI